MIYELFDAPLILFIWNIKRRDNSTLKSEVGMTADKTIQINLAAVACGTRKEEAIVMIKSAIVFSQDALLHVILFSDESSILELGSMVNIKTN